MCVSAQIKRTKCCVSFCRNSERVLSTFSIALNWAVAKQTLSLQTHKENFRTFLARVVVSREDDDDDDDE